VEQKKVEHAISYARNVTHVCFT